MGRKVRKENTPKRTPGAELRSPRSDARRPLSTSRNGTSVALPCGYRGDLGEPEWCAYIWPMTLVLMMVVLGFGLLYVAVIAEERQMQKATKPRKR